MILISFPRDLDTLDCLYNELFCADISKNLVTLYSKNNQSLIYYFNDKEQDLIFLLLEFIQKILKLAEKADKALVHLRILRITASLLYFFPVESKIPVPECQIFIRKILEYYNMKKKMNDLQYIELIALIAFGFHVYDNLLVEKNESQMEEEESYIGKIIDQLKKDNKVTKRFFFLYANL